MTTGTTRQVDGRIHVRREGAIGIIEFDNPGGGYLTASMVQDLDQVTRGWELDPEVRVVVLTGRAPAIFITHYVPDAMAKLADQVLRCKSASEVDTMRRAARRVMRLVQLISRIRPLFNWVNRRCGEGKFKTALEITNFHRMMLQWERSSTVYIGAINGLCMGSGFEIALACDFRLMSRGEHVLGLPELILGIVPGFGGSQRLARLVGPHQAVAMMLKGELLTADEAADKGLISCAVDADQLMEQAMLLAHQMTGQSPLALKGVKRVIHDGFDLPISKALEQEALEFTDVTITRDAAAIVLYYLEQLESGGKPVEIFRELSKGHTVPTRGE